MSRRWMVALVTLPSVTVDVPALQFSVPSKKRTRENVVR